MSTNHQQEDLLTLFRCDPSSASYGEWQAVIVPEISIPLPSHSRTVSVRQNDSGRGELGSRTWEAGLHLALFLASDRAPHWWFDGRTRLLELGSGAGLVGCTAAARGASVTLTCPPCCRCCGTTSRGTPWPRR